MILMLLRMLSGLAARAWRLVISGVNCLNMERPGCEKAFSVSKACSSTGFQAETATWTMSTSFLVEIDGSDDDDDDDDDDDAPSEDPYLAKVEDPYADIDRSFESEENQDRLKAAASFHAKAARKAVVDGDGDGVILHMKHFRRYSGALVKTDEPFGHNANLRPNACIGCGFTCAQQDMSPATGTCFECSTLQCSGEPSWTTKSGDRIYIGEMSDDHLVSSANMVRRWLKDGSRPVTDDRIRMTGHVLKECSRRGMGLSLDGTWSYNGIWG